MAKKALVKQIVDADLKLLRIFKAVVESGGLSAAETELNIGRSTISKYISDLEIRLDLILCTRGPAGFSVTEDGRRVLDALDQLLAAVSQFRTEVNAIKQKLAGTIRISLFDLCASNPESHVARVIRIFNEAAPEVQVELSMEPPNVIESLVIGGHIDVGVIAEHRPSASLTYMPIYGEDMYLYCGHEHRFFGLHGGDLDLDGVRSANYAGLSVNSPNLHVGQQLKLRRSATVQSEHALTLLILSGRYIGFLPDHLARPFVEQGMMQAVLPEQINYRSTFAAITRKTPAPNRITRLFLDTLVQEHSG